MMTIKPNYLRAFLKTFVRVFVLASVGVAIVPYFQGKGIRVDDGLAMGTLAGLTMGIGAICFTPREISWDDETIRIRTKFSGFGDFSWRQLEAWNPYGRGTFLLKFEGRQTYQIAPVGFRSEDWRGFRSFMQEHFAVKRVRFWVGVFPIRFEGKDDD